MFPEIQAGVFRALAHEAAHGDWPPGHLLAVPLPVLATAFPDQSPAELLMPIALDFADVLERGGIRAQYNLDQNAIFAWRFH